MWVRASSLRHNVGMSATQRRTATRVTVLLPQAEQYHAVGQRGAAMPGYAGRREANLGRFRQASPHWG
jgi:hypothetical protein